MSEFSKSEILPNITDVPASGKIVEGRLQRLAADGAHHARGYVPNSPLCSLWPTAAESGRVLFQHGANLLRTSPAAHPISRGCCVQPKGCKTAGNPARRCLPLPGGGLQPTGQAAHPKLPEQQPLGLAVQICRMCCIWAMCSDGAAKALMHARCRATFVPNPVIFHRGQHPPAPKWLPLAVRPAYGSSSGCGPERSRRAASTARRRPARRRRWCGEGSGRAAGSAEGGGGPSVPPRTRCRRSPALRDGSAPAG